MGDAAYPDDWDGWPGVAATRIVECIPPVRRHRQASPRQTFHRLRAATRGLIAVPLDPLLAIFSVAGGDKKKMELIRLDTPHGFIVEVTQHLSALGQGDPQGSVSVGGAFWCATVPLSSRRFSYSCSWSASMSLRETTNPRRKTSARFGRRVECHYLL